MHKCSFCSKWIYTHIHIYNSYPIILSQFWLLNIFFVGLYSVWSSTGRHNIAMLEEGVKVLQPGHWLFAIVTSHWKGGRIFGHFCPKKKKSNQFQVRNPYTHLPLPRYNIAASGHTILRICYRRTLEAETFTGTLSSL